MDDSVGYNGNPDDVEDLMVLEDAPVELVLEVWEPTGDAVVDAALEDLRALRHR
jgi:hypothetical protein